MWSFDRKNAVATIPVIIVETLAVFWPPSLSMLIFRRYMFKQEPITGSRKPVKPTLRQGKGGVGGGEGSHTCAYTTQSSLLCFPEVFQGIMTVIVDLLWVVGC